MELSMHDLIKIAVEEDATLTVPAGGLQINDADVDGDRLTAQLVDGPVTGNSKNHSI